MWYPMGREKARKRARKGVSMNSSIDTSTLEEVMQKSWGKMTLEQLLTSLIILVACLVAVKLIMALARRLTGKSKMDDRVRRYILGGVKAMLYVVTILIVAQSLGIPVTSLIALVSVFGLAVSLAIQDVLSNVAGGMVILFSKPFSLGDYIETSDGEGDVVEISLTHTKLDTYGGQRVMLPNKAVVAGKIINYSARGIRRVDHTITASYDDSTEAVRSACLRAVSRTPHVRPDPAPAVVLTAYKDSAIEYHVRFWADIAYFWDAYNTSLEEIRRCFAEDGVTMTYNHLNVHIMDRTTTEEK